MTTRRAAARLRRPEDPQRATFLELFFDLALVFALFQISHSLIQHLHWSGALQTLVLFVTVWRVWVGTTWITDRFNAQWPPVLPLVTGSLLGLLVMAAALPQAFGKYGLIFAGAYVAVYIVPRLFLALALRGPELPPVILRALVWSGVSAPAWIAGALTHGTARGALWTLAIAADYVALALRYPIPGAGRATWEPPAAAEHLAERYRQVFIIALGELIVVSGLALSGGGFAPDRTAAFVVSIATTAVLLRIYIHRAGEVLPVAFTTTGVTDRFGLWAIYIHGTMVAGIVVTAVGAQLVIAHPSGRTPPAWAVVILGGPVLFLAGRAVFEYTIFTRVSLTRPIGVLALAALTPVTLLASPLLAAIAATAVLAGIAVADAARDRDRDRGRTAEPPSPRGVGPS
jgi:low temperature requirement protein LtrA